MNMVCYREISHFPYIIHTSSKTWYTFIWEYLIFHLLYLLLIKMLNKIQNYHFDIFIKVFMFSSSFVIWELSISHMSYTFLTNPVMWYEKFRFLICHTHLHKKHGFIKSIHFIYILNDQTKQIQNYCFDMFY